MAFSDWDPIAANNTLIGSIDWREGMQPKQINNTGRAMMADLASWYAAPEFTAQLTVSAGITGTTAVFTGQVEVSSFNFYIGPTVATSGVSGQVRFKDDTATYRWMLGIPGTAAGTDLVIYDAIAASIRFQISSAGVVFIPVSLSTGVINASAKISRDANFYMDLSGTDPMLTMDATDGIRYSRATNEFYMIIGGLTKHTFGTAATALTGTLSVTGAITQNGAQVWHATNLVKGVASATDVPTRADADARYVLASGVSAFGASLINDADAATARTTLALGTMATEAASNYALLIANFTLSIVGGNARITFDANDYLEFNRATNKLTFVVGGTAVASVDASGNIKTLGNITANAGAV